MLRKVTHCAGRISANTRPSDLDSMPHQALERLSVTTSYAYSCQMAGIEPVMKSWQHLRNARLVYDRISFLFNSVTGGM